MAEIITTVPFRTNVLDVGELVTIDPNGVPRHLSPEDYNKTAGRIVEIRHTFNEGAGVTEYTISIDDHYRLNQSTIETATGEALDRLGLIMGVDRRYFSISTENDETFRERITKTFTELTTPLIVNTESPKKEIKELNRWETIIEEME